MAYKMYWNNICLISPLEEKYITETVSSKQLALDIEYYGLGRSMYLYDKIQKEVMDRRLKADIIVSTDLDVFQNKAFLPSCHWYFDNTLNPLPIKDTLKQTTIVDPEGYFHPFIIIPLVMVYNKTLIDEDHVPHSLHDLFNPYCHGKVAFGGIHNSAGKSLLKALWYLYGEASTVTFLENSVVTSMPAAAFNLVRSGRLPMAIVPSIFALRANTDHLGYIWPEEGAIAIPSYAAFKKDMPENDIHSITNSILGKEFQSLLTTRGDIIPCHPDVPLSQLAANHQGRLLYPTWDFLYGFDHNHFYKLCHHYNPMKAS